MLRGGQDQIIQSSSKEENSPQPNYDDQDDQIREREHVVEPVTDGPVVPTNDDQQQILETNRVSSQHDP